MWADFLLMFLWLGGTFPTHLQLVKLAHFLPILHGTGKYLGFPSALRLHHHYVRGFPSVQLLHHHCVRGFPILLLFISSEIITFCFGYSGHF